MLNYDILISGFTRNFNEHKTTLIAIQTNYQAQFQTDDFNQRMGNLFHLKYENGVDAVKDQAEAILGELQNHQIQIDDLLSNIQAYSNRFIEAKSLLDINEPKHKTMQNCLEDLSNLLKFARNQKNIFDCLEMDLHEILAEKADQSMVTAQDLLLSFTGGKIDIDDPEHKTFLNHVSGLINANQEEQAYERIQAYAQNQQASRHQFSY